MRKEVVFALIAGSLLGLVIAFGIWRANIALNGNKSGQKAVSSPAPTPSIQFGITLAKPEDLDVVIVSPQTFSGITKPNAWVVISTDVNDYFVQAGSDGTFNQDIKLATGVNQIALTAFSETGETATTKLVLVYSPEFAKEIK